MSATTPTDGGPQPDGAHQPFTFTPTMLMIVVHAVVLMSCVISITILAVYHDLDSIGVGTIGAIAGVSGTASATATIALAHGER